MKEMCTRYRGETCDMIGINDALVEDKSKTQTQFIETDIV